MSKYKKEGYRIIYIDETMFTRKTTRDEEWSLPKENFRLPISRLDEPTLAMLAGVSKEQGKEHYMVFDKSVNVAKFQEYLAELRVKNGEDKICLFMDNLSAHKSKKAQASMRAHGFRYVYNCANMPDWNPIESVFSKVKHKFRQYRAQKIFGLRQEDHRALVGMAFMAVKKRDIVNSVKHVDKLLK